MNEIKTIEERVDEICRWTNTGLRDEVVSAMRELAKEQTRLCHDVVNGITPSTVGAGYGLIYRDEACTKILLVRID